jgi:hypothetical protein
VPEAAIDPRHRSLVDWPKPASLLPLKAAPGDVPFGEAYLAWSADGLALAHIGQDYYDPDLLAYVGPFPLGEAYQLAIAVDAGAGARRFTLYLVPPPRGASDRTMHVQLCAGDAVPPDGCAPVAGAQALYFGADQPRVVAAVLLPWSALGLAGPPASGRLRLELAARSWFRARWMSLSGRSPTAALDDPRGWPELRLVKAAP